MRRVARMTWGAAVTLALGVSLATAVGPAGAQQLRTFKFSSIGNQPTTLNDLYFGLGVEKGWFKEAGIDFQPMRMPATTAFAALASGESDGTLYAASSAVAGLRGAPLLAVYYDLVSAPWSLVVDPKKIKTPKDFAGARCVAATGNKTATHIAEAAMIESIGGDPRNFQSIGLGQPPPFWIEALRVGTAECMIGYDAAWTGQAVREGFKVLAYLPKVWPIHGSGLGVSQAALKDPKKRELLVDVLGVFLRARDYVKAKENRPELVETLRRWMGAPKGMQTEDYEAALAEMATLYPPKGYIEDESTFNTMLIAALKYGIYDTKEFKIDLRKVDLAKAGVVDQGPLKEAMARGGPLYRRR